MPKKCVCSPKIGGTLTKVKPGAQSDAMLSVCVWESNVLTSRVCVSDVQRVRETKNARLENVAQTALGWFLGFRWRLGRVSNDFSGYKNVVSTLYFFT